MHYPQPLVCKPGVSTKFGGGWAGTHQRKDPETSVFAEGRGIARKSAAERFSVPISGANGLESQEIRRLLALETNQWDL